MRTNRKTPGAPRPAYGHSKDGRDDLKQVLLSLGVSGDGGLPLRVGVRDGNRSDSVETPVAIEECLALGFEGVRGIVADSKAYSRRTLGLCLEHGIGLVTLVPRTCAIRQDLEAWGQQQPALPLLVEKPGRTKDEAPRRWHGQSVLRQVEVEYSEGRVAQEELRFVVVHSSQLAQQQAQSYAAAQAKEAEAVADHVQHVQAQWFACRPTPKPLSPRMRAEGRDAAGAAHAPGGITRLRYHLVADTRRTRRARRGRPAKTDPPPTASGYRLAVEVEGLPTLKRTMGGPCWPRPCARRPVRMPRFSRPIKTKIPPWNLAFAGSRTPRRSAPCGWRNPNGLRPWRCSRSSGLLVYSIIQRQVRLYLRTHDQQLPGNKGMTATPTAAVVLALFAQVALVQLWIGDQEVAAGIWCPTPSPAAL